VNIDIDDEGGEAGMTTLTAATNFTVGGVLSWAIPIGIVLVVLVWWATMLTIRAFRARQGDG